MARYSTRHANARISEWIRYLTAHRHRPAPPAPKPEPRKEAKP